MSFEGTGCGHLADRLTRRCLGLGRKVSRVRDTGKTYRPTLCPIRCGAVTRHIRHDDGRWSRSALCRQ